MSVPLVRGPDAAVRLPIVAFTIAGVAFAAQATAQLVDYWAFGLRFAALNGDSNASAFSWVSAVALFGITIAFTGLSVLAAESRRLTIPVAVLFAFLLVDNRAHLHERLEHGKVVFLPALATAFALLWSYSARIGARNRLLLRGGLAFLGVSLFVHLVGPTVLSWAGWTSEDWQFQIKVALKESTEKAGWILICFGALAELSRRRAQA